MRTYIISALIGTAAGAVVGLLVWRVASRKLEAKLQSGGAELARQLRTGTSEIRQAAQRGREELNRALDQAVRERVIPALSEHIKTGLISNGITPELIADVKALLRSARSVGLLQ